MRWSNVKKKTKRMIMFRCRLSDDGSYKDAVIYVDGESLNNAIMKAIFQRNVLARLKMQIKEEMKVEKDNEESVERIVNIRSPSIRNNY